MWGYATALGGHLAHKAQRTVKGNLDDGDPLLRLRSHNPSSFNAHFEALTTPLNSPGTVLMVQESHHTEDGAASIRERSGRYQHVFGRSGLGKKYTVPARGGIEAHESKPSLKFAASG